MWLDIHISVDVYICESVALLHVHVLMCACFSSHVPCVSMYACAWFYSRVHSQGFAFVSACARCMFVHLGAMWVWIGVPHMRMYVPMYVHAQVCVWDRDTLSSPWWILAGAAGRSLNSVPLPPPLDSSAASVCLGSSGPLNLTFTSQGHQRTVQPGVNTAIHTSDKYKMHQKI